MKTIRHYKDDGTYEDIQEPEGLSDLVKQTVLPKVSLSKPKPIIVREEINEYQNKSPTTRKVMDKNKIQLLAMTAAITVAICVASAYLLPSKSVHNKDYDTIPHSQQDTASINEWDGVVVKKTTIKPNQTLEVKLIWKLDSFEEFNNADIGCDDVRNYISLYWDRMRLGIIESLDSDEDGSDVRYTIGMEEQKESTSFEIAQARLKEYAIKIVENSLTRGGKTRPHIIVFESLNPEMITP